MNAETDSSGLKRRCRSLKKETEKRVGEVFRTRPPFRRRKESKMSNPVRTEKRPEGGGNRGKRE